MEIRSAAKGSAGGSGTNAGTGCSAGAIGAVIGDLAAQVYNPEPGTNPDPKAAANTIALAQLTAGIAGAIVGGGQAGANIASAAGANAVENNWLSAKQKAAQAKAASDTQLQNLQQRDRLQTSITQNLESAKSAADIALQGIKDNPNPTTLAGAAANLALIWSHWRRETGPPLREI